MQCQTHWRLGVEILIDQFSNWNSEKNTLCYTYFNIYAAWQVFYLGKMFVHFLELSFLKWNENSFFLFKNSCNKEKDPFYLFESDLLLCLVVAIAFIWKWSFLLCLVVAIVFVWKWSFWWLPYFLNKALDKGHSKQLSYDSANWNKLVDLQKWILK